MNGHSTGFHTSGSPASRNPNLLILIVFCIWLSHTLGFQRTIYQDFMDHQGITVLELLFQTPGSFTYWQTQWHSVVSSPTGFFATPFNSFLNPPFVSHCCSPVATANRSLTSTHLQDKMSLSTKLSPPLLSETLRLCIFSNERASLGNPVEKGVEGNDSQASHPRLGKTTVFAGSDPRPLFVFPDQKFFSLHLVF